MAKKSLILNSQSMSGKHSVLKYQIISLITYILLWVQHDIWMIPLSL